MQYFNCTTVLRINPVCQNDKLKRLPRPTPALIFKPILVVQKIGKQCLDACKMHFRIFTIRFRCQ